MHTPPSHSMPSVPRALGRRELLTATPTPRSPYWVRIHRVAMACRFEVTLSGEDAAQIAAAQRALGEATRLDAQLSVFRDASELTGVNRRAAQGPVAIGRELFSLLVRCSALSGATGGAFDITTTPLSRCWGFLRREGRVPAEEAVAAARALVGMAGVSLDPGNHTVAFARPGMELNLGSIGKGYAVQRIARLLRAAGVRHALVNAAGSSVYALGGRGAWPIDITSRRIAGRRVARLRLHHGAMATSGAGEQYVDASGTRYGHVIDPRSGWPAQGIVSATVVTSNAADADALATAFLVGGETVARRYCEQQPGTLALLTRDDEPSATSMIGGYDGVEVEEP